MVQLCQSHRLQYRLLGGWLLAARCTGSWELGYKVAAAEAAGGTAVMQLQGLFRGFSFGFVVLCLVCFAC
jgi:hypothetical protein